MLFKVVIELDCDNPVIEKQRTIEDFVIAQDYASAERHIDEVYGQEENTIRSISFIQSMEQNIDNVTYNYNLQ